MQAVRNIFWWLCFVALGICVQSLVPCLDALVVGLVILLQERDYKNLCWLLPLFVLLQEGIGTSPFGATIVWYALVCLIYRKTQSPLTWTEVGVRTVGCITDDTACCAGCWAWGTSSSCCCSPSAWAGPASAWAGCSPRSMPCISIRRNFWTGA